jgi:hypothetical protein
MMSQKLVPTRAETNGTVEMRRKMISRATTKERMLAGMNPSSMGSPEASWFNFDTARVMRLVDLKIQMSLLQQRML